MKKYLFGFLIINIMLTQHAYARCWGGCSSPSNCDKLNVEISNVTSRPCVIQSVDVPHGRVDSAPAFTISPRSVGSFLISGAKSRGPEITLSYQCGYKKITIKSQQNYCGLKAGKISATVVRREPSSIMAFSSAASGSYLNDQAGTLSWQIRDV